MVKTLLADSAYLWLMGALFSGVLIAITVHDRRRALRRRRYGAETGPLRPLPALVAVFLLLGGTALVALFWGQRGGDPAGRSLGQIGVAIVLLLLIAGEVALLHRDVGGRRKRRRAICPVCFSEGALIQERSEDGSGRPVVRCTNRISKVDECGFTFPTNYLDMHKLAIPTVGVPGGGKTFWLAVLFRSLNYGMYSQAVDFAPLRTAGAELFNAVVSEILDSRLAPAATQVVRIPHALAMNVTDRDRLGRSQILLSSMSPSGEVVLEAEDQFFRDPAGFFLFLDPTMPASEQATTVTNLASDCRRSGWPARIPVAICVSKLDLMKSQPYSGPHGAIVRSFYDQLGQIGWDVNLTSILARSQATAHMAKTIWPDWPIQQQVQEKFGGPSLFFPLTPVGLGERDHELDYRTIAPVGILEPMLWVLHMNGYPMLS